MVKVFASLLSLKDQTQSNVRSEVKKLVQAGVDGIHIDVMDESGFVSEKSFLLDPIYTQNIRTENKHLPLDVHLMVQNPAQYIDAFARAGASRITIHAEAKDDLKTTLAKIKQKKVACGISVNPKTPLSEIEQYLAQVDIVLVMSVVPGKGWQAYIESTTEKIKALKTIKEQKNMHFEIEVDGGIKVENAYLPINSGADSLVVGSGLLSTSDYKETIHELKNVVLIASDHRGYLLKEALKQAFTKEHIAMQDEGTYTEERCDGPIYAKKVAQKILNGDAEKGILICGTGIGMSIAANKFPNIRAGKCNTTYEAEMIRRHNNANILCLSGKGPDGTGADIKKVIPIVQTFLTTAFEGGRYQERLEMIEHKEYTNVRIQKKR